MNLKQLNRVLMQTLFLPETALLLVAAVLGWQLWIARQTVQNIRVADQSIATLTLVASLTTNEQTGVHEFARTFKEVNLAPYEFALDPLLQNLQKLHDQLAAQQAGNKPEDLQPIDELIDLHREWTEKVAAPTIRAARARNTLNDPRVDYLDRTYMEKIHGIEAGLLTSQEALRTSLADQWQHDLLRTVQTVILFALFGALVLGLFANSRMYLISDAYQNTMEALRSTAQGTYESEQRLRATLTSIGEGVVVCDEDGRIELLNTAAQLLSGWTQVAASHRHMELVFPLVDELTNEPIGPTEFTTAAAYALSAHGQAADVPPTSAILVRSDGTEYFVERSESPIYDRAGYLTGSVTVISDVTERRRTQSALLQSEKLAVAGRLAATIAHEIHNPLDSVVNLLYMMKQGTTEEEREEFVDMAQSELSRVTNISRAMLGMHRESRVAIDLDISAIMQSVLVLLERTITKSGIVLNTRLEPNTWATGYPAELRQVFTNLLTNAADASAEGTTIEVMVYNQYAGGANQFADGANQEGGRRSGVEVPTVPGVIVSISDHGTGISPAVLTDLFRPFFTTKGERGSGLGLWISKGIIEKHAGTINVVSSVATEEAPEDHGTTFTIFLPRGHTVAPPSPLGDPQQEMDDKELVAVAYGSTAPDSGTTPPKRKKPVRRKTV
jgi:signal transduction histidine kinase